MITEAGGELSDFQGRPFSIYSGEILASNGLIHRDRCFKVIRRELTKHSAERVWRISDPSNPYPYPKEQSVEEADRSF